MTIEVVQRTRALSANAREQTALPDPEQARQAWPDSAAPVSFAMRARCSQLHSESAISHCAASPTPLQPISPVTKYFHRRRNDVEKLLTVRFSTADHRAAAFDHHHDVGDAGKVRPVNEPPGEIERGIAREPTDIVLRCSSACWLSAMILDNAKKPIWWHSAGFAANSQSVCLRP